MKESFKATRSCMKEIDGKCAVNSACPATNGTRYPVRYLGDLGYGEAVNLRVYPESCAEAWKVAAKERFSHGTTKKLKRKKKLEIFKEMLNMNCTFIRETDEEIERRFEVHWDGCKYEDSDKVYPGTRQEQWDTTVPDLQGNIMLGRDWQKLTRPCHPKQDKHVIDQDPWGMNVHGGVLFENGTHLTAGSEP